MSGDKLQINFVLWLPDIKKVKNETKLPDLEGFL